MTLDDIPDLFPGPTDYALGAKPRCRRHQWATTMYRVIGTDEPVNGHSECVRCGAIRDEARARRGRNNRKRGNAEELTVARAVGGRKVGQMQQPWDVEMPGYARLQVKKLATPPSLRFIAAELSRIGSGAEMPGFVWIEPGRGGEQLITFRLRDFAERHGVVVEEDVA
jgi:hypothetical protein